MWFDFCSQQGRLAPPLPQSVILSPLCCFPKPPLYPVSLRLSICLHKFLSSPYLTKKQAKRVTKSLYPYTKCALSSSQLCCWGSTYLAGYPGSILFTKCLQLIKIFINLYIYLYVSDTVIKIIHNVTLLVWRLSVLEEGFLLCGSHLGFFQCFPCYNIFLRF